MVGKYSAIKAKDGGGGQDDDDDDDIHYHSSHGNNIIINWSNFRVSYDDHFKFELIKGI